MSKPKKKAKLKKLGKKIVLIKEDNTAFAVSGVTATIWKKCDGKKEVSQIVAEIGLEDAVYKTINQLGEAGLVDRG